MEGSLIRALRAGLEAAWDAIPLFEGRPRVLRVALGHHLATVSRYIHLNPVLAGLVWTPEDWPHSSYRAYLGDPRANTAPQRGLPLASRAPGSSPACTKAR